MVEVPATAAEAKASTGICYAPRRYFEYLVISKAKALKPAVTVGGWEKWKFWRKALLSPASGPPFMSKISLEGG
jgi:hypothetical protein